MRKSEVHRGTGFALLAFALLILLGVSACRDHSTVSPPPQPVTQLQAQAPVESAEAKSCFQFVQAFYDSYFDRLNAQKNQATAGPSSYDVSTFKPQVLAPELLQMLKEDVEAASKNQDEIVGLDFDPFINAQDWEGKYWVNSVTIIDGACHADVWGMDAGKKHDIVHPMLKITNGNWIFVDFFIPKVRGAQMQA